MATAFPTLSRKPSRQSWSLQSNTQVHVSPLDGSVQTQSLPGARWLTTIEYDNLLQSDAAKLQGFLVSLGGRAGRALVPNFGQPRTRGNAGLAAPLVNGSFFAGATSIGTDFWNPGVTMEVGDFFGLDGFMYQLTQTCISNGSGQMTLVFGPGLRATPLDNTPVIILRPMITMMLLDDRQGWQYAPGGVRSYVLDFVEVL